MATNCPQLLKPPGVPFGFMLLDRSLKLGAGKQLQQLRENATYSIHG